jgi:LacI family transcriptional regulator
MKRHGAVQPALFHVVLTLQRRVRMPTMHEVARKAGVSLGTVSNVLNHPELVAEETRERVLRVITTLGFVRNGSARQLRVGSTQSIGLVVLDVSNPFFTEVARGAEAAAWERGYSVILCNSDNSLHKEANYLQVLEEQRVAGILIVPVEDPIISTQALRQRGIAVVLLDRLSLERDLCSVSVDDVYGGHVAGSHLLERGHRRIAYIHGPLTTRQYADRLAGLQQAVREAALDPDEVIVSLPAETDNAQAGEMCVKPFLQLRDRPTAIFCGNDYLALGVMHALTRSHVHIPRDVALIGYDDIDLAPIFSPPLTTIRQPKYDLGYTAANLLLNEITSHSSHQHQQVMFRPELVCRESTTPV